MTPSVDPRPRATQGVALGVTYIKAGFSTVKYLLLGLAFVLVTPIGIAIGIGVGTSYNRRAIRYCRSWGQMYIAYGSVLK